MRGKERELIAGMLICLFLATISFKFSKAQTNTVRINEFLALNNSNLTDEDGDYSDWIELYNPSEDDISLEGWALTDEADFLPKWVFPAITLEANEYLIVFASGKNKTITAGTLHTNFKISGDGEYLSLVDPDTNTVTEFTPYFPPQQDDISYGLSEGVWIAFNDPTPGESNENSESTVIPPPEFSHPHGFYESSFSLNISTELPSASIYYTRDGSAPSSTHGTLYTSPISIDSTAIIRAVSTVTDQPDSKITTQTYLFLEDILDQPDSIPGYPGMWGPYSRIEGNAIADYEMDPEMMSDPAFRDSVKNALTDIPTLSLVTYKDYLFSDEIDEQTGGIYIYTGGDNKTGLGWERPASMEYFNNEGSLSLQADCGLRIQGGQGRVAEKSPKHSFRVIFRGEYGLSRLRYPFFGEEATDDINSITFRAGFCNSFYHWDNNERRRSQYIRDSWAKDAQLAMGHPGTHNSFVHLYLNGIYWGLYNATERIDDDFGEAYMGGDREDYDVIKDYTEVLEGTIDAWDEMMSQAYAGLSGNEAYQKIQGKNPDGTKSPTYESMVDVENLIDYMLINFYGGNTDWDNHNWAAVRNREKPGKGFKFICWDSERVLESPTQNVVNENEYNCPSGLFQKLTDNAEFKRIFADHVLKHLYNGGILTSGKSAELFSIRSQEIAQSIHAEAARWGDYRRDVHQYRNAPYELYDKTNFWEVEQEYMYSTYFPSRTNNFLNQLRNAGLFPNADAPMVYLNDNPVTGPYITTGDVVTMNVSEGTIFYTADGSDPADWGFSNEAEEFVLIAEEANKKAYVPHTDIGTTWLSDTDFNDSGWEYCTGAPGGIGYEKSSGYQDWISLDVGADMHADGGNPNTSCYMRIPFEISAEQLETAKSLFLKIRYDDGFAAYLNGVRVADANAPAAPAWNSTSTSGHEASSVETFNISEYVDNLVEGTNLLAIQGFNLNTTSSDFILLLELIASDEDPAAVASETAEEYTGPITLDESVRIQARTYFNGEWSARADYFFILPENYQDLKITEINYNPLFEDTIGGNQFEFVEIKNTGTSILDLGGVEFVNGIDYLFPQGTELKSNEFIVLASNNDIFYSRYQFYPFDEYKGKLDNDGEWLIVTDPLEDTIIAFRYNDGGDWPGKPDGLGYTLVPTDYNPTNNQQSPFDWRASYDTNGSPGADDLPPEPEITPVEKITESFALNQNFPNPFSEVTYINYNLSNAAEVQLTVYNIMGQQVTTLISDYQNPGAYQVSWNGRDQGNNHLPNGVYFYNMVVKSSETTHSMTKKMLLMR